MHQFIAWSGFVGAWLLVAGPVYQAAIELQEESFDRNRSMLAGVVPPPRPSRWWWLLPPVGFLLQRRWVRRYRDSVMAAMSPARLGEMVRFSDKATGWAFVALGAFWISVKETYEVRELYEWPVVVFWLLVVVMALLCLANTVVRVQRTNRLLASAGGQPGDDLSQT